MFLKLYNRGKILPSDSWDKRRRDDLLQHGQSNVTNKNSDTVLFNFAVFFF